MSLLDDDLPVKFLHPEETIEETILVEDVADLVGDESSVIYVDDNDLFMDGEVYETWPGDAVDFQEISHSQAQVELQPYDGSVAYVDDAQFEFTLGTGNAIENEDQDFLDPVLPVDNTVRSSYNDHVETAIYEDDELPVVEDSIVLDFDGDGMQQLRNTNQNRRKTATVAICEVCGVLLKHPSKIEAHMRTHTGEKPLNTPYDCSYGCGKKFVNNAQKNAHELRHFGTKRAGPPRPHLKPPKRSLLKRDSPKAELRMREREEERAAIVDFAPPIGQIESPISTAASKSSCSNVVLFRLDEIIDSVVSGIPVKKRRARPSRAAMLVQCQICGLMIKHASKIRAHIRTHTGDKPYICVHCDEQFGTSSTLSMHVKRKHSDGERPYACTWDCGKRFVSLSTRNEHERIVHAGAKRYECSIAGCLRMFTRRYYLMLHRQRVHGLSFKPIFDPEEIFKAEKEADREFAEQYQEKTFCEYNTPSQVLVDPSTNMLVHVSEDGMVLEPDDNEQHAFMQGEFVEEADDESLVEVCDNGTQHPHSPSSFADSLNSQPVEYILSDVGTHRSQSRVVSGPCFENELVGQKIEEQLPILMDERNMSNLENTADMGNECAVLPRTRMVNILKKKLSIRPSLFHSRL
ncbi:hypothetical protein KIN20_013753 [Parelaphostrongylus tenuis]|uniref:C2H2-type domain-containing protein n=1 Tax=Parelaphostrongylus tenuis TaxID=148309 RepID=A0AAD5MWJ8_PARTN|nr:hypothetical protein KIN20_013753 [Parelaphostrongylus tenuis]